MRDFRIGKPCPIQQHEWLETEVDPYVECRLCGVRVNCDDKVDRNRTMADVLFGFE